MQDHLELLFHDRNGITYLRVTLVKNGTRTVLSDTAVLSRSIIVPVPSKQPD